MQIASPIPTVQERNNFYAAALRGDNQAILNFLQEFGEKYVDVADTTGWTALLYATLRAQHSTMTLLLENGASLHATTSDGKTAINIARDQTKTQESVDLIVTWEAIQRTRAERKKQEELTARRQAAIKKLPRLNPFHKKSP